MIKKGVNRKELTVDYYKILSNNIDYYRYFVNEQNSRTASLKLVLT